VYEWMMKNKIAKEETKEILIDQLYQTKPNGTSQIVLLNDPYPFPTELMD